jgi:hypothetical protein
MMTIFWRMGFPFCYKPFACPKFEVSIQIVIYLNSSTLLFAAD